MTQILGTINAGYEIISVTMFSKEDGVVIGRKIEGDTSFCPYVVWSFNIYDGQLSFYWGQYVNSLKTALNIVCKSFAEA